MTRFFIREAHLHEYDDIRVFYEKYPDDHVMLRNEFAVKNAIQDGVFFLCVDPRLSNTDRIVAASAVYSVETMLDTGGSIVLKEAGGSNVRPEFRGYGIHKIFHWSRSLHKFILDRKGFSHYFSAILHPNPPSEKNLSSAGFVPWQGPPQHLVDERAKFADASRGQTVRFFELKIESLAQHAVSLLAQEQKGVLEKRRDGNLDQIEVHIATEVLKHYKPVLNSIIKLGAREALNW